MQEPTKEDFQRVMLRLISKRQNVEPYVPARAVAIRKANKPPKPPRAPRPPRPKNPIFAARFKRQERSIAPETFNVAVNGYLAASCDTLYEAMIFALAPESPKGFCCISWEFGRVRNRTGQKSKGERIILVRDTANDPHGNRWLIKSDVHRYNDNSGVPRVRYNDRGKVGR